jgi:hypothetical protein
MPIFKFLTFLKNRLPLKWTEGKFVCVPVVGGVAAAQAHPVPRPVPAHQQQNVRITVF